VIVPAGYSVNRPLGLSILGTGYSEPKLISYAYDYEQFSRRRVPPTTINDKLIPASCG
jgi:amidase